MRTLITGGSGGIGLALARVCARHGHDLVLVSRSADRLEAARAELRQAEHVDVDVMACDLALPGAVEAVAERHPEVDALVNSAGFGMSGPLAEADDGQLLEMLRLNVEALTRLTRLYLPSMVARRSGRIVNLSSMAGFQPGPNMAAYYATKAYVLSLSEGLREELRGTGVTVTTLAPGPVRTGFQERAGVGESRLFTRGATDLGQVAEEGFRGMMTGKGLVVPGTLNRLGTIGVRLIPRSTAARLAAMAHRD
jgi:short-subunit dehydrogenase